MKRLIIQCYIEETLMNGGGEELPKLIPLLASIYLKHIIHNEGHFMINQSNDLLFGRQPLRQKWIETHINTFKRNRTEWLNILPPFDQQSNHINRLTSPFLSETRCIDYFYVEKLQGLLCFISNLSPSSVSSISDELIDLIKAKRFRYCGKLSIQLLTWPQCGYFDDAIDLLVKYAPHISRSYCKQFCKTTDQWRTFLTTLLESTEDNHLKKYNDGDDDDEFDRYNIYKEVLEELANTLDPERVLSLLPPNGNIHFFLPFIAKCFRSFKASKLKDLVILQTKSHSELHY